MKYKDITGLTVAELNKKSKELREELFQAKMKNSLGQLGNPIQIRGLRRNLARIQTAMNLKLAR